MQFPLSKIKHYEVETWELVFVTSYPRMILMLFICGSYFHYILKSASYGDHDHCPQFTKTSGNVNRYFKCR